MYLLKFVKLEYEQAVHYSVMNAYLEYNFSKRGASFEDIIKLLKFENNLGTDFFGIQTAVKGILPETLKDKYWRANFIKLVPYL